MHIRKAIIPVAGMGTRFLPAAKAQPKEMLSVVDKPVIQYIVEEAVASGIEEIIFVTAIGKRAIEDHFDRNFELEYRLEQKKKMEALKEIQKIGKLAKIAFVRQTKPLGDGHAILSAIPFVEKHEPVAILFGDDIIDGKVPALKQLIDVYNEYESPVIALQKVPKKEVSNYGVIGGKRVPSPIAKGRVGRGSVWQIDRFVEKPTVAEAPSDLIVIGRYIITPEIMAMLPQVAAGKDGEIRLADAFAKHLSNGKTLYGCQFDGTRYDCGSKLGFVKAQIELGLKHKDIGAELKKYLKSRKG